ncbi:MAG: TolC family protein [Alphaproteobacteria bacterium]|nr:TolC family protein [Alphaproteobacteria bacterium]
MIWLWPFTAHAEALTLEDALRRGLDASEQVELAEAARERAAGDVRKARAGHFPQVGAQLAYTHQFASEYDGLFDVPAGPTGYGTPTTTATTTTTTDDSGGGLPFGADNTWRLTLSATQPIWSGNRVIAQDRMSSTSVDLAELGWRSTRAAVVLSVAQAWYDAALADRLLDIARSTLEQAEATFENARLASEVGRGAEFDVLRAQVEVENQRVAVIQAERARVVARLMLANLLDADPAQLEQAVDLEAIEPAETLAAELVGMPESGERVGVQQAQAGVFLSEQTLVLSRSYALPSLSANAQVGWVAWPGEVLPPLPGSDWRDTVAVGATLTVPLFGGGAVGGELRNARAGISESHTRLDQAMEADRAEAIDAAEQLRAAEAQWEATSGTVEQAERAYAIAVVRFEEGVSRQIELSDARLLRQRALANRAQAARDLQVARIRVALLPLLPFQTR